MHARVVTYIGQLGKIDEIVSAFQEQITPSARKQPGFSGGLLLTDRATGKVMVVSLWETEAAMVKGEADGYMQAQMPESAGSRRTPRSWNTSRRARSYPFQSPYFRRVIHASAGGVPTAPSPAD